MKEDIKVIITLENKERIYSGYRPTHLIDDYYTTGILRLSEGDYIERGESKVGFIAFISPEAYPNTMEIGMRINIFEGAKCIGHCTVLEIYNDVLKK